MTVMTQAPATPFGAPVMCRNMQAGPTVIAADGKRSFEVIFAGAGDPDGEDVQPIPEELLRTPQFAKAIRQGVFTVEEGGDNPYVQNALARQGDAFRRRSAAERDAIQALMVAPAEDDMVGVACIGPGNRPGAACGELVPIRAREAGSRPPLCDRHGHLADNCTKRGRHPWQLELDGQVNVASAPAAPVAANVTGSQAPPPPPPGSQPPPVTDTVDPAITGLIGSGPDPGPEKPPAHMMAD